MPHAFVTAPSPARVRHSREPGARVRPAGDRGLRGADRLALHGATGSPARSASASPRRPAGARPPVVELDADLPSATALTRVRSGRARRAIRRRLDVVDLYQRFIARLDRAAIREAVEERALSSVATRRCSSSSARVRHDPRLTRARLAGPARRAARARLVADLPRPGEATPRSGSSVRRLLVISRPARGMGVQRATPFRAPASSSPTWCFASSMQE